MQWLLNPGITTVVVELDYLNIFYRISFGFDNLKNDYPSGCSTPVLSQLFFNPVLDNLRDLRL